MPEEKQCWWMIRNEKFIHMVQEQDPMERIAFKDNRPEKARRSADTFQSLSAAAAGTAGVHVLCDDDGGDFIQILLWWKLLFVVDGEYIVFHTASHEKIHQQQHAPVYR